MQLVKGYALMIAFSAAVYGVKPGSSTSKTLAQYGGGGGLSI